MQTHVKLFCCGSAQMIMKIDFQQMIIFKNTKQNLTIKTSSLKKCFPCETSFALIHAFCSRALILHTAELLGKMQIVELSCDRNLALLLSLFQRELHLRVKKVFRKNPNEQRRKKNYKGGIEI